MTDRHLSNPNSHRFILIAIFLILGMASMFFRPLYAAELNGSLSSEMYFWEAGDSSHIRPYESIRADLIAWRPEPYRQLSFHTYLRWTTDLSDKFATDPQTYIYDSYLRLAGYPSGSNIYLGRQFVYSAAGSAFIDGLRFKYNVSRAFKFDMYGGSNVSGTEPEKVQSLSDNAVAGMRLSYILGRSNVFGLNWMMRRSDGSIAYHRVGFDLNSGGRAWNMYNRVSYNAANLRLAEFLSRVSWTRSKWYISGEFNWREPSVPGNTLFTLVEFNRYKQIRLELNRALWQHLRLVTRFNYDFFTEEDSWNASLGLNGGIWSLSWRHKTGYGGDNDGLVGFTNIRLYPTLELYASANFSRYRVQDMQEELSDSYMTTLGIQKNFGKSTTVRAEGQYLRNAVRNDDTRFYFRFVKGFSFASHGEDGE
ncbi:MAG: hypothetical protein CVT49_00690 [candidate division Zixibacteria bacterium HGW-Zixibacteria-1]|nr:MAG: hypothetical protein CVT49_00690 [candidate division Zixibacteria bacterium HGW-Zixibacteria-1]